MIVLVDYDNVDREDLRAGVLGLVDTIARAIDPEPLWEDRRLDFRLYGGWYEDNRFTRLAQNLAIELYRDFPRKCFLICSKGRFPVSLTTELAYSIAARPEKHLFATYRHRGQVKGRLICRSPNHIGCQRTDCPMTAVERFFRTRTCPHKGCSLTFDDFLSKSEQKLVDSMLITDLLHYSKIGHRRIALTSSDDDFWPGILAVLIDGVELIHIHTKDCSSSSRHYLASIPKGYHTIKL